MNVDIDEQFRLLTDFTPRQFQRQAIAQLLDRRDIILHAPTGSGKTETAIAPFLMANKEASPLSNKLIYVVPLRTLANSLCHRVRELVDRWYDRVIKTEQRSDRKLTVTLQTGENPEDSRFEGDIIFCTIDQLLSSFLSIPYSVGRNSANVNAGAILSAYLVFDELHLLEPNRSFATVLRLLQETKGLSPFLLMTATLSDRLANIVATTIDRGSWDKEPKTEVISVSDPKFEADLQAIEADRDRRFQAMSVSLTADEIIEDIRQHNRQRVIVIVNVVSKAQALFHDLISGYGELDVILLHSRFASCDRRQKENDLERYFGRNWAEKGDDKCRVLISTQVIEVGINISCDILHTELAPMSSLLQRAGRCARFKEANDKKGEVRVYRQIQVSEDKQETGDRDLPKEEDKQPQKKRQFLPYEDEICEKTWEVLADRSQSDIDRCVGFRQESEWIDRVHTDDDLRHHEQRERDRMTFETYFHAAVFRGERYVARELIRHIDNRLIFISDKPITEDNIEVDLSQLLLQFSLPVFTLERIFSDVEKAKSPHGAIFYRIESRQGDNSQDYKLPIAVPLKSKSEIRNSFRLLVDRRYVSYNGDIGLLIGADIDGTIEMKCDRPLADPKRSDYCYRMDTYIGHLGCLWTSWEKSFSSKNEAENYIEYASVRDELLETGRKFMRSRLFLDLEIENDTVWNAIFEYLVFLAVFGHDLGKLQVEWQKAVRGWQDLVWSKFKDKDDRYNRKSYLLAHTDYDPGETDANGRTQKEVKEDYDKANRRPPHAIEGAFILHKNSDKLLEWILQLHPLLQEDFETNPERFENLIKTAVMAAGRHHTAWTEGWNVATMPEKIVLEKDSPQTIADSWRLLARRLPQQPPFPGEGLTQGEYLSEPLELNCFGEDDLEYYLLYLLVVRGLRLCDTRAVQLHQKG